LGEPIRLGGADAKIFNFDPNLPGKATVPPLRPGDRGSGAFASCQVQKAFKAVCLRAPSSSKDAVKSTL